MWQQQGAVIDQLVSLIQTLQLRRETGRLIARHGEGHAMKEGSIVFTNGKITEVWLDRRSGSEALNKLSMWENCSCWFVSSDDNTKKFSIPDSPTATPGKVFTPLQVNTPSSGSLPLLQKRTDPLERNIQTPHIVAEVPYVLSPLQPALAKIDRLGLSRAHRRLFLLIDGQRSIPDLIRLASREKDEVSQLLQDLEHAMLIHIPGKISKKER